MVNTPGSETALNHLKSATFTEHHVALVDAHVIERYMAMAVRSVIEAHD
jgi:hypothetical protein